MLSRQRAQRWQLVRGVATWQGRAAEHYHWVEKADPLPIPLDAIDFYVDVSDPHAAVPLFKQTKITPFGGPAVGYYNETYASFRAGPPDPKKFDIAGVAACPKSTTCGAPELQMERLALGQIHTFLQFAAARAGP